MKNSCTQTFTNSQCFFAITVQLTRQFLSSNTKHQEKNNVKNKAEVNLRALEKSIISDEEKGNYTDTCKYKVTSVKYRLRRAHKYWPHGNYGAANCNKRIENYK